MAWTLSHALFSLSRPSTTATFLLLQPSSVEKTLISQTYFFIYFNLASGGVASTIALVTIGFLLIETQSLAKTVNGKKLLLYLSWGWTVSIFFTSPHLSIYLFNSIQNNIHHFRPFEFHL